MLGVRPCNSSSRAQGFALNHSSAGIEYLPPPNPHTGKAPELQCAQVWATTAKGPIPELGPFVETTACDAGGSSASRAGRTWNLTEDGKLVSQMGALYNSSGQKPGTPTGPCLVPQRGAPNLFGPLQLWSKPQPNGAAAVFINSQGSTWGNNGVDGAVASFKPSEIPGLRQGAPSYKVRDIWNRADLPAWKGDAPYETGAIAAGDSRLYLLTPAP